MNKTIEKWDAMSISSKIIITLVILVALYFAIQFFKAGKSRVEEQAEILQLQSQGVSASYTSSKYKSLADTLYIAMDGAGTDEDSITDVFSQIKNDIDFVKLDQAFGTRDGYTMTAWIRSEVSAYWISVYNSKLLSNGLTKTI